MSLVGFQWLLDIWHKEILQSKRNLHFTFFISTFSLVTFLDGRSHECMIHVLLSI